MLFGTRPQWSDDYVYVHCLVNKVCGLGHASRGVTLVFKSTV